VCLYVRGEDVNDGGVPTNSNNTDNSDVYGDCIVPRVGNQGILVPMGMDKKAVRIEYVSGSLVDGDNRH
jgi:hypothetical protein